ncbi:hypothetical protein ACVC7T_03785 [Streptococcus sp. P25B114]
MTTNEFLNMSVADVLKIITENDSDYLEAKITKDDGRGILVKVSYEPVEVE